MDIQTILLCSLNDFDCPFMYDISSNFWYIRKYI